MAQKARVAQRRRERRSDGESAAVRINWPVRVLTGAPRGSELVGACESGYARRGGAGWGACGVPAGVLAGMHAGCQRVPRGRGEPRATGVLRMALWSGKVGCYALRGDQRRRNVLGKESRDLGVSQ